MKYDKIDPKYGSRYYGKYPLKSYDKWGRLIEKVNERAIIIVMSENEGNMDDIQSYDSEILTFGAMQKTISTNGYGEFAIQVYEFKETYPSEYEKLFSGCGWIVEKDDDNRVKMYYLLDGEKISGKELKIAIRDGFSNDSYTKKISCAPLFHLIKVGENDFLSKRILK